MTRLEELDLSDCPLLSNAAAAALGGLPALSALALARCPLLTDTGLAPALGGATRLARLDASGLHRLQGASLAQLSAGGGGALSELRLDSCVGLRDHHLAALCAAPRLVGSLIALSLSGAAELTDAGLAGLTRLAALTRLDLSFCSAVTGSWLVAPGEQLPASLTALRLAGCSALSDGGLLAALRLARLRELDLGGCWRLSDAALGRLGAALPDLRALSLRGCIWLGAQVPHPPHTHMTSTVPWLIAKHAMLRNFPEIWVLN